MTANKTGVEVQTGFFPLAFLFFFCTPRIEIDGQTYKKYWGSHFFELPLGPHKITIYFPYLGSPRCGENSVVINVEGGTVKRVSFFMPPWVFSPGWIKVA